MIFLFIKIYLASFKQEGIKCLQLSEKHLNDELKIYV